MKKIIFNSSPFQEAYEKSQFSIWDKVMIVKNAWCVKSYDRYMWTTAIIIWVGKLTNTPWNPDRNGLLWFRIDCDEYNHFKSWKRRFPSMLFWECELKKI